MSRQAINENLGSFTVWLRENKSRHGYDLAEIHGGSKLNKEAVRWAEVSCKADLERLREENERLVRLLTEQSETSVNRHIADMRQLEENAELRKDLAEAKARIEGLEAIVSRVATANNSYYNGDMTAAIMIEEVGVALGKPWEEKPQPADTHCEGCGFENDRLDGCNVVTPVSILNWMDDQNRHPDGIHWRCWEAKEPVASNRSFGNRGVDWGAFPRPGGQALPPQPQPVNQHCEWCKYNDQCDRVTDGNPFCGDGERPNCYQAKEPEPVRPCDTCDSIEMTCGEYCSALGDYLDKSKTEAGETAGSHVYLVRADCPSSGVSHVAADKESAKWLQDSDEIIERWPVEKKEAVETAGDACSGCLNNETDNRRNAVSYALQLIRTVRAELDAERARVDALEKAIEEQGPVIWKLADGNEEISDEVCPKCHNGDTYQRRNSDSSDGVWTWFTCHRCGHQSIPTGPVDSQEKPEGQTVCRGVGSSDDTGE